MLEMKKDFKYLRLLILISVLVQSPPCSSKSAANGLGDKINWVPLEAGFETAKAEGKPLMLIIHKSWCGACKAIKEKIAESKEIEILSKKFVCVNTMDDDEPKASDDRYSPDGTYIPRILFYGPDGTLFYDEKNIGGNDKYKYYYYSDESIVESMNRVYERVRRSQRKGTDGNDDDDDRLEL